MGTLLRYLCLSHSGQLPFYSEFSTAPFRIAQCGKTIHWSSVQASLRSFVRKQRKVLSKKITNWHFVCPHLGCAAFNCQLIDLLWACWLYREQLSKWSLALKYFLSSYLGLTGKTVHRAMELCTGLWVVCGFVTLITAAYYTKEQNTYMYVLGKILNCC